MNTKIDQGSTPVHQRQNPFIAIIDDDSEDSALLAGTFKSIDLRIVVEVFSNAGAFFNYLRTLKQGPLPSLVIIDINLPLISGHKVLTALQEDTKYKALPKIVYSTSSNPLDKAACLAEGASAVFTKSDTINGTLEDAVGMLCFALNYD